MLIFHNRFLPLHINARPILLRKRSRLKPICFCDKKRKDVQLLAYYKNMALMVKEISIKAKKKPIRKYRFFIIFRISVRKIKFKKDFNFTRFLRDLLVLNTFYLQVLHQTPCKKHQHFLMA